MKIPPILLLSLAVACGEGPASPPPLEVSPSDVLSTRTRNDGLRDITFQKLDPVAMAEKERQLQPPVRPVPVPSVLSEPSSGNLAEAKPLGHIMLGASVHIPDESQPGNTITQLQLWLPGKEKPAILWTNANFLWLTGVIHEMETSEYRQSIHLMASRGIGGEIPEGLTFPDLAKASLVIGEGDPTEEQLAPIDYLIDLYNRDKDTLRARFETARRQSAEAERQRQLNPPEKKDIIIRYWNSGNSSANETPAQGGAR